MPNVRTALGAAEGAPFAVEAAARRHLGDVLDLLPQIVWSARPDGHHDYYNDRWYEFTGAPYGSTDGEGWNSMFHPDDRPLATELWRRSLGTGDPYEIEYRLLHHSGQYRWALGRAVALRNAEGGIERWFGTCTDIDDLKRAEEQRELIARELSHRIKNIFAVVRSLVQLSARADVELRRFADLVTGRIDALARAHDHVRPPGPDAAAPRRDAAVDELVQELLAPYADEGRVVIESSCGLSAGAQAATSLALILHELATNAAKYGALSNGTGRVHLTCRREADTLVLSWRESGGPPIAGPPERQGFGTLLTQRALTRQLGADLRSTWHAEGLAVDLTVPIARLAV
jgi:PAS domain S-box-containing protein